MNFMPLLKTAVMKKFVLCGVAMPERKPAAGAEVRPGELYREIAVSRAEFEGEARLVKKPLHWFVKFCRNTHRRFPSLGAGVTKFDEKRADAVAFLGWDLKAEEFSAAVKFVMLFSVVLAVVLGTLLFLSPAASLISEFTGSAALVPLYIFMPLAIIALYLTYYVQNLPLAEASIEQTKALTYVPEVIGYMIMSVKLVPNLEKAVEFSAAHGRGKIAEDFRKLLWDVQLGVYTTLSEGLDELAYRWGKFSSEFKLALMRVRASVIENTEAKRYAVLDKTMEEMLESIRNKMELYARGLSQPSEMLFYLGVLLPLILIIILPVGSSFSGAALANPTVLVIIYNIAIPAAAMWFAFSLIKQRPPTYEPPKIPDDHPGLPKKGHMRLGRASIDIRVVMALVFVAGISLSYIISSEGIPFKSLAAEGTAQIVPHTPIEEDVLERSGYAADYFSENGTRYAELVRAGESRESALAKLAWEKQVFFMRPANDITPYPFIFGSMLTIALCAFVYLYYTGIYKRKAQLEVMEMEAEFKDSLYVIASRMGESKPVEEAIRHTKEFLPQSKLSQFVFARVLDNISLLGMPLEEAVFDPNYGALKHNPSAIIRSSMKLLVDSVRLGVNVAARTLMSLSMQLTNSEKVSRMLSTLISDTTNMMRSMAIFIAPIVLGITASLQKVVVLTISSISASEVFSPSGPLSQTGATGFGGGFSSYNLTALIKPEVIGQLATPTQFVFIVAIYIVELVLIMTYFTTKIEEDNDLLLRINMAKALPIAVAVFILSILASNTLLAGFLGGA